MDHRRTYWHEFGSAAFLIWRYWKDKFKGIFYGEMANNGGYVMEAEGKLRGYFMETW